MKNVNKPNKRIHKPDWLKIRIPSGDNFIKIKNFQSGLGLSTVCQESACPNMGECWSKGTATFMLMGDSCTRTCGFCAVNKNKHPPLPDSGEPEKIAQTIGQMNLKYAVLTSVDRDDLPDLGAGHFYQCVRSIKKERPQVKIELLIPDFQGKSECLALIVESKAEVIAHNLETVRSLTPKVRDPLAGYDRSLEVLDNIKKYNPQALTKSSLMLGLGEDENEIFEAMEDLRAVGVDFLTLGQYLQPARNKLKVKKYLTPEQFSEFKLRGLEMGFAYVASGPLVRSSYQAGIYYYQATKAKTFQGIK
ncbi:MAG: lipoyl synthase [Deltaproteobacteria bacterium]|nr:lipoyl synthase [Deltaproteobacteria bacterium]